MVIFIKINKTTIMKIIMNYHENHHEYDNEWYHQRNQMVTINIKNHENIQENNCQNQQENQH